MNYVVGSGPAGVSAAAALLEAGAAVTMVDVGIECEPERLAAARALAACEPQQWKEAELATIRGPDRWDPVLPKLCHGSDFAYALEEMRSIEQRGTRCLLSFARGGLSSVWGAAVLPTRSEDMNGWPIAASELAAHYAAAGRWMPVAATRDDLASHFSLHAEPPAPLEPSRQAAGLLEHMRGHRPGLTAAGIVAGQARLAVSVDGSAHSCRYCGLCLSGCPYGAIWNAGDIVERLKTDCRFAYRPGLRVLRVESLGAAAARLLCRRVGSGDEVALEGDRVFVACGSLGTARLIIDSLGLHGRALPLQYQPYFLLPALARRAVEDVERERLHTLAQIFIEICDRAVSEHTVHLQLYTYNSMMGNALARAGRWLSPLRKPLRRHLLGRLLALQGYLHSAEAEPIRMLGESTADGTRLRLTAPSGGEVPRRVRQIVAKLWACRRELGMLPVAALLRIGQPGEGNHIGATFPMRESPGELETDRLGRLAALPSVHLLDGSVLPSLAATTLTYTIMANAHRIASEAVAGAGRR